MARPRRGDPRRCLRPGQWLYRPSSTEKGARDAWPRRRGRTTIHRRIVAIKCVIVTAKETKQTAVNLAPGHIEADRFLQFLDDAYTSSTTSILPIDRRTFVSDALHTIVISEHVDPENITRTASV